MSLFNRHKTDEYYDDDDYPEEELVDQDDNQEDDDQEEVLMSPDESEEQENETPAETAVDVVTQLESIAPAYWSTEERDLDFFVTTDSVGGKLYGQPFYVPPAGYPRQVNAEFFTDVLATGICDITVEAIPQTPRKTIQEMTSRLHTVKTNKLYQQEKGQEFAVRENVAKEVDYGNLITQVSLNENSLFDNAITGIVYGSSLRELEANAKRISNIFGDQNVSIQPFAKRVKSGYFQTIPLGAHLGTLDDIYRNVDRKALSRFDIARGAAGKFNGGIPWGYNQATPSHNIEYLSIFGSKSHKPINYNMGIVGESGGGKTVAAQIKIAREVGIMGYQHRSIDNEREYVTVAKALHELNLDINEDSGITINPLEFNPIETPLDQVPRYDENGELIVDDELVESSLYSQEDKIVVEHDGVKYVQYIPIKSRINHVSEVISAIFVSQGMNPVDVSERSAIDTAMTAIIEDLGITSNPKSLLKDEAGTVNEIYYTNMPKEQPTFTMLYNKLTELYPDSEHTLGVKDAIKPLLASKTHQSLFDGQTYYGPGIDPSLNSHKYVNFSLADLEGANKRFAYFIISDYLWNRWMRNPALAKVQKVLDADELLGYIDDPIMQTFIETVIRQDRKRNGSLTWIVQDIDRFEGNKSAQSLVTNSEFFFITQISSAHRQLMKDTFDLTDGILEILLGHPNVGEGILIQEGEATWVRTNPNAFELDFAESNDGVRYGNRPKDIGKQIDAMLDSK